MPNCPVCDAALRELDLPQHNLFRCDTCGEIVQQLNDSTLVPLGPLLKRHALGDDRVRAAISAPHIASVRGFLDTFENSERMFNLNTAEAKGAMRDVLTHLVNRLDHALNKLSGLDFASDDVSEAMTAIREARELASPLEARKRGIRGGE